MRMMWRVVAVAACIGVIAPALGPDAQRLKAQARPQPATGLRLYVFDLGKLAIPDPSNFGFTKEELATTDLAVAGYLIVHSRGTLIWDTGVVPDAEVGTAARGAERAEGHRLGEQLAAIGYRPADITYLAFSHYHSDHTANGNTFKGSTWLVRKAERDVIFAEKPAGITNPSHFTALKDAKTTLIDQDEYDVFRDGTVIVKSTPGHTPGHQVLVLKLAQTGTIVLAGDLYHYPEERTAHRFPTFEFDKEQSAASRGMIEQFVTRNRAQLWIEHDYVHHATLQKSPSYYE
jgi:N-acyl homoserine lactone hydrolase